MNFYPVTRFLVTPLLVTRYCVTLFSNTRFSPPLPSPKDKDQLKIILTWGSPDRIKFPLPSRNTLEAWIFFKKLFRQLKHEIRSCLKILLFKKKKKITCRYINYIEYISDTFISRFERLSSSLTADNLQAIFITTLRELIFIDRWGSFLMPDTSCS